MSAREVRRFVDDLLRGRRTRPFKADEADLAELNAAIMLRGARPGSGAPSEEFLAGLHRRLAGELAETEPERRATTVTPFTRRRFVQGASIAAAAATIGAVGERTIAGSGAGRTGESAAPADATLTPSRGVWRTVAASADVPDGSVRAFSLGSVTGFVRRRNGTVGAVSGSCTHQGCLLMLNAPANRLDCPCHNAAFAVTGELISHQLPVAPRPLPQVAARELDGSIQVYAPPSPA